MISLKAGGNDEAWYEQPSRLKNGKGAGRFFPGVSA